MNNTDLTKNMKVDAYSKEKAQKKNRLEHWHIVGFWLMIYDICAVNLAYLGALWLRFDCSFSRIPAVYFKTFLHFAPIYSVVAILVFFALRLYKSMWRFASYRELERVLFATIITTPIHYIGIQYFFGKMP